jgi:hypothetical protein
MIIIIIMSEQMSGFSAPSLEEEMGIRRDGRPEMPDGDPLRVSTDEEMGKRAEIDDGLALGSVGDLTLHRVGEGDREGI